DFAAGKDALLKDLDALAADAGRPEVERGALGRLHTAVGASAIEPWLERCHRLAARADEFAAAMDFRFPYRADRHLCAIGYNATTGRLEGACYDLLASEARLASFLVIARGDASAQHWFHLGRLVTPVGHRLCLLSWGGTMFEYLMPELLLRR